MTSTVLTQKKNINKIKAWILAIRPKTLFASLGPVIVGTSLAYKTYEIFDLTIFIITMICAVLLQISTNLANDYLDAKKGIDSINRIGPLRVTQSQILSITEVQNGFFISIFFALLFGLYLMITGGWPIIIIGFSSLWFAYAYSGGPYPLSHHGLGEITAFIFFGPVATMGTHFLQSHVFDSNTFIIGSALGMISLSILAINNLRDIYTDGLTQKRTLAVRFGEVFQRKLSISGTISALILLVIFAICSKYYFSLISLLTIIPYISTIKYLHKGEINSSLNDKLANTGKFLFIFSLFVSITIHFPLKY